TDEQLIAEGHTPVEDIPQEKRDLQPQFSLNQDWMEEYKDLAEVVIVINKAQEGEAASAQKMKVFKDSQLAIESQVSTGTEQLKHSTSGRSYIANTPVGFFRPTRIFSEYDSITWTGASMPNAVFFSGGV